MAGTQAEFGLSAQLPARSIYGLAIWLAAIAGFVDAISYVQWRGLYVSFMSGNSTAFSAAVASANWSNAAARGFVLVAFVIGVVCGELLGRVRPGRGRPRVMLIEAALLAAAAVCVYARTWWALGPLLLAIAMGVQNVSLQRAGGASVALTYVTGALVRFGRAVAGALLGRRRWGAALPYLALWIAFAAGAVAGAVAVHLSAPAAIAIAAFCVLVLAATTAGGATASLTSRKETGP